MQALSNILGRIFRFVYETLSTSFAEPEKISYYAIALLIMSIIYKLITIPMTLQQTKATKRTAELQPKMEELKKKYGYDQQILNQKMQEFQRENNVASAGCSSCLMMILSLVVIMALFSVVRNPGPHLFDNPDQIHSINKNFLWIEDLSQPDPTGFVLALLNSLSQLGVSYLSQQRMAAAGQAAQSQALMLYGMPLAFFFIFRTMPAGLVLYWVAGNIIELAFRGIGLLVGKKERQGQEEM